MKKTLLLLLIATLAVSLAHAQADWINYKIDNKLSVKVPGEPKKSDDYSVIAQTADTLVCVISVIDMQKVANIDSAALAGLAPTDDFANGLKTGMLGKMQGFTLGDIKTGKWNGYYCYNIEGENAEKKLKTYTFMVIIGSTLYSLSAVQPDNKNTAQKDDFFTSLRLN